MQGAKSEWSYYENRNTLLSIRPSAIDSSGKLKFIGQFNDKHGAITGRKPEVYYGSSYPVEGTFYAEDGSILYQGAFRIQKQGSIGYPKVVIPEGFWLFNMSESKYLAKRKGGYLNVRTV